MSPRPSPFSFPYTFAPARVNLIGEHLDYNGGLVLPMALNFGMSLSLSRRQDNQFIFRSQSSSEIGQISLDQINEPVKELWWRYPLAVLAELTAQGLIAPKTGLEFDYKSAIPMGSGLSSSAAMTVSTAYALLSEFQSDLRNHPIPLAQLCQKVENHRIGVQCGIMDPLTIAAGQDQSALLMDCSIPKVTPVTIPFTEQSFVILDTRAPRSLADSQFNERRRQCEEALRILKKTRPLSWLCEAKLEDLTTIDDALIRKRARHVVTEQARVLKAVQALEANDPQGFGALLSQSHASLKDDYEVSCKELDLAVYLAEKSPACLGARMTGAGFGGCAIALVEKTGLPSFEEQLQKGFEKEIGHELGFLPCLPSRGVRSLDPDPMIE